MLLATFDLFQAPLHQLKSRSHSSATESLIDSSSVALFSKMQSLVASLTALIIEEEMDTRMEESHALQDNSAEFSDDEPQPFLQISPSRSKRHTIRKSPSLKSPSFQSPTLPEYTQIRHNNATESPYRQSLQPLATPMPRSFSSSTMRSTKRYSLQPQYLNQKPSYSYSSPVSNKSFNITEEEGNMSRRSSVESRKRYSMRF